MRGKARECTRMGDSRSGNSGDQGSSLGPPLSLDRILLEHPQVFYSFGTLTPSLGPQEVPEMPVAWCALGLGLQVESSPPWSPAWLCKMMSPGILSGTPGSAETE